MRKTDLGFLATKQGLKKTQLVIKEGLARLDKKIDGVEKVLQAEIQLNAQETKEEIREEIHQSENQILNVLDSFLGELKTPREEKAVAAHQASRLGKRVEDHEKRITALEQNISPSG